MWRLRAVIEQKGAFMRIVFGLLWLVSTLAVRDSGSAQSSHPPFSISISVEKPEVKAGSDVYIKIQMTNTSNHAVDCTRAPSNGSDRAYQYDVREVGGVPASKVARPHPEIGETFHSWPCVLNPGESTTMDDSLISKLYDMSRPAKYLIQVSRFISGDRKENGVVKSNTITLTVTP
jgi:hypothetical protein